MNGREIAGPQAPGKLGCIATVSFDTIAGPFGNFGRGDDIAFIGFRKKPAVEMISSRAGFVADLEGLALANLFELLLQTGPIRGEFTEKAGLALA